MKLSIAVIKVELASRSIKCHAHSIHWNQERLDTKSVRYGQGCVSRSYRTWLYPSFCLLICIIPVKNQASNLVISRIFNKLNSIVLFRNQASDLVISKVLNELKLSLC